MGNNVDLFINASEVIQYVQQLQLIIVNNIK